MRLTQWFRQKPLFSDCLKLIIRRNLCFADNIKVTNDVDESKTQYDTTDKLPGDQQELTVYQDNYALETVEHSTMGMAEYFNSSRYFGSFSVERLLSRSYEVASFNFTTSNSFGSNLINLDLPKLLLDQPFIADIMKGFRYFRCKGVKITFRPQATPFHYGAIGVHHFPLYWEIPGSLVYPTSYPWLMNVNPHLIDIGAQKAYEIEVPWELPLDWINYPLLPLEASIMARVFVMAMTPLQASSENTPPSIPVSVFANFIEPEVTGPLPDSSLFEFEAQSENNSYESHWKSSKGTHTTGDDSWDVTALRIVETAEKLAPLLSALDKPNGEDANHHVVTNNAVDLGYMTGLDNSHALSTNPRAQMPLNSALMGGFSGKPTISWICQKPGFLDLFNITSSQMPGDLLWSRPVDPIEHHAITSGGYDFAYPTPLAFASAGFTQWRGSLKYTIFAVLSNMQSARVRITFTPSPTAVAITNHTGDILSEVYDIRSGAMINFSVPYISTTPYRSIRRLTKKSYSVQPVTHGAGFATGTIQVNLITPLIQPSTVSSSSATLFVYVAGGPDYEPVGFQCFPMEIANASNQYMYPGFTAHAAEEFEAQASLHAIFETEEYKPFKDSPTVRLEGVCHAEKLDDWLAIGKRYSGVAANANPLLGYEKSFEFIGGPHIENVNALSFPTCWLPLFPFRFYRGSVNRKLVITDNTNRAIAPIYRFIDDCQGDHRPLLEPTQWTQGGNTVVTNTLNNTSIIEFMIPYLCLTPFIPLEAEGLVHLSNRYFSRPSRAWLTSSTAPGVDTDIHLMSLGDDIQVAGFLAPPVFAQITIPPMKSPQSKPTKKFTA